MELFLCQEENPVVKRMKKAKAPYTIHCLSIPLNLPFCFCITGCISIFLCLCLLFGREVVVEAKYMHL
jgi:hypothetical protein